MQISHIAMIFFLFNKFEVLTLHNFKEFILLNEFVLFAHERLKIRVPTRGTPTLTFSVKL